MPGNKYPDHKVSKTELLKQASASIASTGNLGEFWQWAQGMRDIGWLGYTHEMVKNLLSESGYANQVYSEAERQVQEEEKVPDKHVFRFND